MKISKIKEYSNNIYPAYGQEVMGTLGDGSFFGPNAINKGNSKKPIYKTPTSSIHYKKNEFPNESDFYNKDNWEVDQKQSYISDDSAPKNSIHRFITYDELHEINNRIIRREFPGLTEDEYKSRYDELVHILIKRDIKRQENMFPENKNYDDNITPTSSIHYNERDVVPGEKKMKFEISKLKKSGFVPDQLKNVQVQGDWNQNLNKAVMDLTGEAQPQERFIPVPIVPIGNTPEFPYSTENSDEIIYPIPGEQSCAIKKEGNWTFGNTPALPSANQNISINQEQPYQSSNITSDNSFEIPCTHKPLIKKLLMFIKNEQKNIHEGVSLNGIYEGKVVKLNTIYEGVDRRFKTYVKSNGNIYEIHFGPKKNEVCELIKK